MGIWVNEDYFGDTRFVIPASQDYGCQRRDYDEAAIYRSAGG